jgi:hypothetical protein
MTYFTIRVQKPRARGGGALARVLLPSKGMEGMLR